jgi:hypothetical protein
MSNMQRNLGAELLPSFPWCGAAVAVIAAITLSSPALSIAQAEDAGKAVKQSIQRPIYNTVLHPSAIGKGTRHERQQGEPAYHGSTTPPWGVERFENAGVG